MEELEGDFWSKEPTVPIVSPSDRAFVLSRDASCRAAELQSCSRATPLERATISRSCTAINRATFNVRRPRGGDHRSVPTSVDPASGRRLQLVCRSGQVFFSYPVMYCTTDEPFFDAYNTQDTTLDPACLHLVFSRSRVQVSFLSTTAQNANEYPSYVWHPPICCMFP